ncbi:esterase E4 [Anabrus simplex]|uniref:esterase E4 n=1 Tax=Anabrus simplex TaxID=316456 RepID=UPI0035A30232
MCNSNVIVFTHFVCVLALVLADVEHNSFEVNIKQGRLRGHGLVSRKGREIAAFQGIPYAAPPLGELRFKSPQPPPSWKGVRDATQDSPFCTQRNIYLRHEHVAGEEDCLYLNVYTPQLPSGGDNPNFDVMVWFHGGGWMTGAGISKFYGPQFLLDHNIVLVTLNFRLGPLGFLSTGDAVCPGNNGLKDQVAALRWVQENIAVFGGNPNSVTIFGESAGGASVHYHMMSPMSKGLFHKAISQSGTALCPWSRAGSTVHHAHTLAKALGCPTESADLIDCLRKQKVEDIITQDKLFMEWDVDPHIPFRPVIEKAVGDGEEAFIIADPMEFMINLGEKFHIPWMNGITSDDGALKAAVLYNYSSLLRDFNEEYDRVAPISLYWGMTSPNVQEVNRRTREFYFGDRPIDENAVKGVVDLYTDCEFLHCADQAMRRIAFSSTVPVYYYLFSYRGTASYSSVFGDKTRDYGVCHADDLQYLFPMDKFFPGITRSEDDLRMVEILTTLWTNFARTGNPTPEDSPVYPGLWKPVTSPIMEYLNISSKSSNMGHGLFTERVQFWDSLPIHPDYLQFVQKDEL